MLSKVHIKSLDCSGNLLHVELDDVLKSGIELGAELLVLLLELDGALTVVTTARLRGLGVLRRRGGRLAAVATA